MLQRVPSTQALRALEAFARLGSIWMAAEHLHLTKSAVTHQLRQLEKDLGFRLTNKVGTRLELTHGGRRYAGEVRKALGDLRKAAVVSSAGGMSGTLTVSCPPGFASNWLCTCLGSFQSAFPDIQLNLTTPRQLNDVSNPDADVFIAFGQNFSGNVEVERLKEISYTPFCSPAYLNQMNGFSDPDSLSEATLLHLVDYSEWKDWMRMNGLSEDWARRGIRFADMNLVYAAALAGQGIAMGDEFVCSAALLGGTLVRPFAESLPTKNAYYLALPLDHTSNPLIAAFVNWMKGVLHVS